ncbi:MAG: hypothetical protein D6739_03360, partial [Nitrospirae bacterium]
MGVNPPSHEKSEAVALGWAAALTVAAALAMAPVCAAAAYRAEGSFYLDSMYSLQDFGPNPDGGLGTSLVGDGKSLTGGVSWGKEQYEATLATGRVVASAEVHTAPGIRSRHEVTALAAHARYEDALLVHVPSGTYHFPKVTLHGHADAVKEAQGCDAAGNCAKAGIDAHVAVSASAGGDEFNWFFGWGWDATSMVDHRDFTLTATLPVNGWTWGGDYWVSVEWFAHAGARLGSLEGAQDALATFSGSLTAVDLPLGFTVAGSESGVFLSSPVPEP